jgi:hypothetical protein
MAEIYAFIGTLMLWQKILWTRARQNSDVNIIIKQNQTNIRNNKEKVLTVCLRNETSSTVWGILSIFCIQNAVKLKKYTRKCKITNIRTSCIWARLRVYPDTRSATFRNHFGLTLFYENPDRQRSSSTLTHFYVYDRPQKLFRSLDMMQGRFSKGVALPSMAQKISSNRCFSDPLYCKCHEPRAVTDLVCPLLACYMRLQLKSYLLSFL